MNRKQLADKNAKRLQKARDEVSKVLLATQVLTCNEGNEACLAMSTALNWIDASIRELGQVDPRKEAR